MPTISKDEHTYIVSEGTSEIRYFSLGEVAYFMQNHGHKLSDNKPGIELDLEDREKIEFYDLFLGKPLSKPEEKE